MEKRIKLKLLVQGKKIYNQLDTNKLNFWWLDLLIQERFNGNKTKMEAGWMEQVNDAIIV